MNAHIVMRWIGRGLQFLSIIHAFYILTIVVDGDVHFNLDGWIVSGIIYVIPLTFGAILLVLSVDDVFERRKYARITALLLMLFYVITLIGILFMDAHRGFSFDIGMNFFARISLDVNLIPFKTIWGYIDAFLRGTMNRSIIYMNLGANLLLFLPCGMLLPALYTRFMRFKTLIIFMVGVIFVIEVIQMFFGLGSFDIDDLILNTIGVIVGWAIIKLNFMQKILGRLYIKEYTELS